MVTESLQQPSSGPLALIAGLGNPGSEYTETRHNVGFEIVDRLRSEATGVEQVTLAAQAAAWAGTLNGAPIRLLKPMAFMNRSGDAVGEALETLELPPNRLLVVYDCMDLPLGRLRLRHRGSSGGHRGMESIIQELGTSRFPRLRIGIGRPSGEVIDYVLSRWAIREQPLRDDVVDVAAEAVCFAVRRGMDAAMNAYNPWVSTHLSHTAEPEGE